MKKLLFYLFCLLLVNSSVYAKDGVKGIRFGNTGFHEIKKVYTHNMHLENNSFNDIFSDKSFTVDFWIKPNWSATSSQNGMAILNVGELDNAYDSFTIYFFRYGNDDWRIEAIDDDNAKNDLKYSINYSRDFKNKVKHIAVVYKALGGAQSINTPQSDLPADNQIELYIDGELVRTVTGAFHIRDVDNEGKSSLRIGVIDRDEDGDDAVVHPLQNTDLYSMRIWQKALSDSEINEVKDKFIAGEEDCSFYNKLKFNLFVSQSGYAQNHSDFDNGYSWRLSSSNISSVEQRDVLIPPVFRNFNAESKCDKIELSWDTGLTNDVRNTTVASYKTVLQRKLSSESDYETIGNVDNNYVTDYVYKDNSLMGENLDYRILRSLENGATEFGSDNVEVVNEIKNVSTIKVSAPKNLIVYDSKTSGGKRRTDGKVEIRWDSHPRADNGYSIHCGNQWHNVDKYTTSYIWDATGFYGESTTISVKVKDNSEQASCGSGNLQITKSGVVANKANEDSPTAFTIDKGTDDKGPVVLSWNFNDTEAPATSFKIFRKETTDFELIGSVSKNSNTSYSFTDNSAKSCVIYKYKVQAVNSCTPENDNTSGISSESADIKIVREYDNVFEGAEFKASTGYYNDRVELEWSVNDSYAADVKKFEIHRTANGESSADLIATIETSKTRKFIDNNTRANMIYEYHIIAYADCEGSAVKMGDGIKALGFRTVTGFVSGNITFKGIQAVEGVIVKAQTEGNPYGGSLDLNGETLRIDKHSENLKSITDDNKSMAIDFWLSPDIIDKESRTELFIITDTIESKSTYASEQPPFYTERTDKTKGEKVTLSIQDSKLKLEFQKEKLAEDFEERTQDSYTMLEQMEQQKSQEFEDSCRMEKEVATQFLTDSINNEIQISQDKTQHNVDSITYLRDNCDPEIPPVIILPALQQEYRDSVCAKLEVEYNNAIDSIQLANHQLESERDQEKDSLNNALANYNPEIPDKGIYTFTDTYPTYEAYRAATMGSMIDIEPTEFVIDTVDFENGLWKHIFLQLDMVSKTFTLVPNGDLDNKLTDKLPKDFKYEASDVEFLVSGHGLLDEFRLWSKLKSNNEIVTDRKRIVSSREPDLLVYYSFDQGMGDAVYDFSKSNNEFNNNNLIPKKSSTKLNWSDDMPPRSQLFPAGVTDENGNYTISGITFAGGGEIFDIIPVLGVHEFSPKSTKLFIGDEKYIHNEINFQDISSFEFEGYVKYANTENYPVAGAKIYIDNKQVFDKSNKAVLTGADGTFKIEVPIGEHTISVKKDGHTFENDGCWPNPETTGGTTVHNFMDNVPQQTFYDNTKVKYIGRFVGGELEGNKKLGFHKSKANIGKAEIILEGYDNSTDIDPDSVGIQSQIKIYTNEESGEFTASLIPEKFKIKSVKSLYKPDLYNIDNSKLGEISFKNIPEISNYTDSVFQNVTDTTKDFVRVDTCKYHFERKYIYYSEPELLVTKDGEKSFIGDETFDYYDPESDSDEPVETIDITGGNSPFRYPVFRMLKPYDIHIKVVEIYENGIDTVKQPVEGINVKIYNKLEVNQPTHQLSTNSEGVVVDGNGNAYDSFQAGAPNMSRDVDNNLSFTNTLQISAERDGNTYNWEHKEGDNIFVAYILGANKAESGSEFVTVGPAKPLFVLYDPPGSNSYAYLESGSEYTKKQTVSMSLDSRNYTRFDIQFGCKFMIGGGLIGPVISNEVVNNYGAATEVERSSNNSGEFIQTYKFRNRIETSSDPDMVGTMGDVYVGESTNMFFQEINNLRILKKDFCESNSLDKIADSELANQSSEYTLGIKSGYAVTPSDDNTLFVYSHKHIIETLIPNYEKLIKGLLSGSNYTNNIDMSSADSVYYGTANDHPYWEENYPENENASYTHHDDGKIDSVKYYNDQIAAWVRMISDSEEKKINKSKLKLYENVSFDGGVGSYLKEYEQIEKQKESERRVYKSGVQINTKSGVLFNKFGFMTVGENQVNINSDLSQENEEQKSLKWGYVLKDSDVGDYFNVDAYIDPDDDFKLESSMEKFLDKDKLKKIKKTGKIAGFTSLGIGLGAKAAAYGTTKLSINKLKFFFGPNITKAKVGGVGSVITTAVDIGLAITQSAIYQSYAYKHYKSVTGDSVYFTPHVSSPMFVLNGGRSKCPYEAGELSSFHLDGDSPVVISNGTVARENPIISILNAEVANVPANRGAIFTIKLKNESHTKDDLNYQLKVREESNPHGAIIKIDGLSPNRTFHIPYGETLTKTMTVEKGAGEELEYKDLEIMLISTCQDDLEDHKEIIGDMASFTAKFIPACSEVAFKTPGDNWVINSFKKKTLDIEIDQFDINSPTLERIVLQYRKLGYDETTLKTWYKNQDDYDSAINGLNDEEKAKHEVISTSVLKYIFEPDSYVQDGNYELIVKSFCTDDSEFVADPVEGLIDRIKPKLFGMPQPSDGIVSAGNEISVRFNETIDQGEFYVNGTDGIASVGNVEVRGILNRTEQKQTLHDASIHFDGVDQHIVVPSGVDITNTPFTFAFWAKRDRTGEECIISQGDKDNGGLWIGFDSNDKFKMIIGGVEYQTELGITNTNLWNYYGASFEPNYGTIQLCVLQEAENIEDVKEDLKHNFNSKDKLYIGYDSHDGGAFKGNVHGLRLWNKIKTINDLGKEKATVMNGKERNLVSYWKCDEATGDVVKDVASGKNAEMNAAWHISRDNRSLIFNGTDSYAVVEKDKVNFGLQDNFTLEFWYMANSDGTILSTGRADGTDQIKDVWFFGIKDSKFIVRHDDKQVFTSYSGEGGADGEWHHVAMVANRQSSSKLYIDGRLKATTSSFNLLGFGGSFITMGATRYQPAQIPEFENFLSGNIDEVRIWNGARTEELLDKFRNSSLTGNEPGLVGFYPFEEVNQDDPSASNTTLVNMSNYWDVNAKSSDCVVNVATHDNAAPMLKLAHSEQLISFNAVVNGDKIIFTPDVSFDKIENQQLTFYVTNIFDMNGNKMDGTISWTAYFDTNTLIWSKERISITTELNTSEDIVVPILNKGGSKEYFTIDEPASWLSVSETSGSLDPLSTKDITISFDEDMGAGVYSTSLYLKGNMNYDETLNLTLKVVATPPDWSVDESQFTETMNIIGKLKIAEDFSTDENDILAAFVDGKCRGVVNVEHLNEHDVYIVNMTVYSNSSSGEKLKFRIWDADKDRIYHEVTPDIDFTSGSVIGMPSSPQVFSTRDISTNQIQLVDGWKWVSFNLMGDYQSDLNLLTQSVEKNDGDIIKSKNYTDTYDVSDGWDGTVTLNGGIQDTSMYMIKHSSSEKLIVSGTPVSTGNTSIPIRSGWNWISYTPQENIKVKEALGYHNPTVGDVIKSQNEFAVYDENLGWFGSMNYMKPTLGYMYNSKNSSDVSFYYPEKGSTSSLKAAYTGESNYTSLYSVEKENTSSTMNVIAELHQGGELQGSDYSIGVFNKKGICCGIAKPVYNSNKNRWMWFASINGTSSEELQFKVKHSVSEQETTVSDKIYFKVNNQLGTISEPLILNIDIVSDVEDNVTIADIKVSPNPVVDRLYITNVKNVKSVRVINATGEVVVSKDVVELADPLEIDMSAYSAGTYVVETTLNNGETKSVKVVKQ